MFIGLTLGQFSILPAKLQKKIDIHKVFIKKNNRALADSFFFANDSVIPTYSKIVVYLQKISDKKLDRMDGILSRQSGHGLVSTLCYDR